MNTESPEPLCDASGSLPEQTVSREVVVVNAAGLHARPADLLAREARKWRSRIELVNESQRADGKSILELLTLAAESGTRLVVEATGPDAREALEAIGGLFERRFNEHDDRQDS
ncbi:MAG: HPr family phosphocarrier protein [Planctomycetes bacterium]|nr:HPr family phosphocarrier protein [Planctomycetota bacterium]MBM4056628.1 HPr family phosphocarrier protein [Planctomycetota bacterium]